MKANKQKYRKQFHAKVDQGYSDKKVNKKILQLDKLHCGQVMGDYIWSCLVFGVICVGLVTLSL